MLVLAGGTLGTTGLLVVFGALTGRLAAILAAAFKPADLEPGYSVAPGVTNPLNPLNLPGLGGTGGAANGATTPGAPKGTTGLPKTIGGSTVQDPLAALFPRSKP